MPYPALDLRQGMEPSSLPLYGKMFGSAKLRLAVRGGRRLNRQGRPLTGRPADFGVRGRTSPLRLPQKCAMLSRAAVEIVMPSPPRESMYAARGLMLSRGGDGMRPLRPARESMAHSPIETRISWDS